jgi:putative CocE/NonD family hydrolase
MATRTVVLSAIAVGGFALASSSAAAQNRADDSAYVMANYTKQEVLIPMRDGVKLFTSIYTPKDQTRSYPIMMQRTPYNVAPYGTDKYKSLLGPSARFERDGFIFVYQDVRGRFMSEGVFANVRPLKSAYTGPTDTDEASDTYDTIDWLIKNLANNNGKVGIWGISYPGGYAEDALVRSHPALKAVSPQAPVSDWGHGDDWHDNGTFRWPHAQGFLEGFDRPREGPTTTYGPRGQYPTPDGYQYYMDQLTPGYVNSMYFHEQHPYWDSLIAHPNYDSFWKARNALLHLKDVTPAVMTVGGWFDNQNLFGALKVYKAIESQSPNTTNSLVMGPWTHGMWSRGADSALRDAEWGSNTGTFYRDSIEYPFFAHYLKDEGATPLPKAYVFQTGSNRWQKLDAWPPNNAVEKTLYLQPGGRIAFTQPSGGKEYDQYTADPFHPVPYTKDIAIGMTATYADEDQRFAEQRPDVLTFQTDPLTHDVSISGPVDATMWVATSGTDADYIVKLIDVFPDSIPDHAGLPPTVHMGHYEMLVRADGMRARFRNGFENPAPMVADQPTKVPFQLNDVNHTFRAGHRIMVQVQSSWFPIEDLNPQTYVPNVEMAKRSDFRTATQRIYHTPAMPSQLKVLVVEQPVTSSR